MDNSIPDNNGVVLVMGETGVGKSYFIDKLKAGSVELGSSLESHTSKCQAVQIYLDADEGSSVTIVDTPGFNDTHRTDGDILAEISTYLAAQYAANVPLYGIIYLHDIRDTRMKGSSMRCLQLFRSLCGDHALGNVILVTTFWGKIRPGDMRDSKLREQDLVDNYWAPMQARGSYATQFDGTRECAESLALELVKGRESITLDIQRELVDNERDMGSTTAGRQLVIQLNHDLQRYTESLGDIKYKMVVAADENDKDKLKQLAEEKAEVAAIIKQLQRSHHKMDEKIGVDIKERVDEERKRRKRDKIVLAGVSVMAAVLSLSLTVVKFIALG